MPSSNTPLLNLSLLIDVTFSTPTGDYTHPMRKDVKEKSFSPPLEKMRVW
jgi:hypothetical protein